jgi:hypothetical protein
MTTHPFPVFPRLPAETLDPKERGYGDELAALAAGSLAAAARAAPAASAALPLLAALLALEAAQVRRTVSAPLRLAAAAAAALLGAPRRAATHFEALDIKSILHDTMTGHWLVPALLGAAAGGELAPRLAGLRSLHRDQVVEAADALMTVYEQGTYSKAAEFVDFRERLERSHTRAAGRAERAAAGLRAAAAGGAATLRAAAEAEVAEAAAEAEAEAEAEGEVRLEQLRFNEDLSTRPAWFPPAAASGRLALPEWWEGAGPAAGYARCWWSPVAAAEREGPDAEAWRRSQRAALLRRRRLPALLAGVLREQPLPTERLAALRQALGEAYPDEDVKPSGAASAEALVAAVGGALFAAGLALHAAAAAGAGDVGALAEQACAQLTALQAAFQRAGARAAAALTHGGAHPFSPLPANGGAALAAALLTEEAAWCGACLQAWVKLVRAVGKGAGACGSASGEALQAGLRAAAASVHATVSGVGAAAAAAGEVDAGAAAERALAELQERWSGEALWGWEPQFDAGAALREVFEEQRETAGRLHVAAAAALAALKPLAA